MFGPFFGPVVGDCGLVVGGLVVARGRAVLLRGVIRFLPQGAPFVALASTVDLEGIVSSKREKYVQGFPRRFHRYFPAAGPLLPYLGTVLDWSQSWGYYPILSQILFSGLSSNTKSNDLPSYIKLLSEAFHVLQPSLLEAEHRHGSLMNSSNVISPGTGTKYVQFDIIKIVSMSLSYPCGT